MTALTIERLQRMALRWCPQPARWDRLIVPPLWSIPAWGPAHEIAHALVSLPSERSKDGYGLCDPDSCRCQGERCNIVELAAMRIAAKLHLAANRRELIQTEADATDGYDMIDTPWYWHRAARLLARRKLTRIPRTVEGLEQLLSRRLGQPARSLSPADRKRIGGRP